MIEETEEAVIAHQKAFTDWITAVFEMAGQHICIDGKTMRGVKKLDPDSESHVVTAYIAGLKVTLDEVFVSKKSNEINAIMELFDLIDIKGHHDRCHRDTNVNRGQDNREGGRLHPQREV